MKRRVAIYVYSTTVVAVNQSVELRQLGKTGFTKLGDKQELQKGIYFLDGDQNLLVSVGGLCEVSVFEEKDPWPRVSSNRLIDAFGADASDADKYKALFGSEPRGL